MADVLIIRDRRTTWIATSRSAVTRFLAPGLALGTDSDFGRQVSVFIPTDLSFAGSHLHGRLPALCAGEPFRGQVPDQPVQLNHCSNQALKWNPCGPMFATISGPGIALWLLANSKAVVSPDGSQSAGVHLSSMATEAVRLPKSDRRILPPRLRT